MSVLWVHDGYQKEFGRKISDYTSELSDIQKQYTKAYEYVSAYSGDSSISSSNIYLKKRKKDLQGAIDKANALKRNADNYVKAVVSADMSVSNSIHKKSYSFYKLKGIGPQSDSGWARAWNAITTTASDFWHDACGTAKRIIGEIKEFYEEYKYIFNIVFDILAIAAAVALFAVSGGTFLGVVCAIGAIWATTKATYELVTDCMAVGAWIDGDIGRAEDLSNRTLTGDLISAGEWLDEKIGISFFEPIVKVLTIGLEVCQFVATLMTLFNSFKDIFNLKLRADGKPLTVLDHTHKATFAESVRDWRMTKWGGTLGNGARFKSATNWLKFGAWGAKFSFEKNAKSGTEFALSIVENKEKNIKRTKEIIANPTTVLKKFPGVPESLELGDTIADIILK